MLTKFTVLLAWMICLLFETAQQISFSYSGRSQRSKKYIWLAGGISFYLIELVSWMWLLSLIPLGIAMPIMGGSYITVALAGRFLFKERIDFLRWLGILFIILGLVLIGGYSGQ